MINDTNNLTFIHCLIYTTLEAKHFISICSLILIITIQDIVSVNLD